MYLVVSDELKIKLELGTTLAHLATHEMVEYGGPGNYTFENETGTETGTVPISIGATAEFVGIVDEQKFANAVEIHND